MQPGEGPLDEIAWTNKGIMLAQQGNHIRVRLVPLSGRPDKPKECRGMG